METTHLSFKN